MFNFENLLTRKVVLSFLRVFVPLFVLLVTPAFDTLIDAVGQGNFDMSFVEAFVGALVPAAITAAVRALQALFTTLETPAEVTALGQRGSSGVALPRVDE